MRLLLVPLLVTAPLLAAFGDPGFGAVIANNIAVQAGPLPTYAGIPMEATDARLVARAVNRYRRGVVTPLTLPRSASVGAQVAPERPPAAPPGSGGGLPQ